MLVGILYFLFFTVWEYIYFLPYDEDLSPTTTKASGFLASHRGFNFGASSSFYPKPTSNILTMSIPSASTILRIKFIRFNIGRETVDDCETTEKKGKSSLDQFSIYNGGINLYGCGGGQDKPGKKNFHIISPENTLTFNFTARSLGVSGNQNHTGFLLSYTGKSHSI